MTRFAQAHTPKHSNKTRTLVAFYHQHIAIVNVVGIALVLVLAVLYIAQVNRTVTSGYAIRDLESQINELALTTQKLEVASREAQSLDRVASSVKMLGLVEAGSPRYIASSEPSYALAR